MIKKAKIITIALHSIIIIAAGHGMGIMLMMDLISIPAILKNGIEINLSDEYESRHLIAGFVSIIGKILLIISLFLKQRIRKNVMTISGLTLLLASLGILTIGDWTYDSLFMLSFASGIPFLMYLGRVIFLLFKEKNETELNLTD